MCVVSPNAVKYVPKYTAYLLTVCKVLHVGHRKLRVPCVKMRFVFIRAPFTLHRYYIKIVDISCVNFVLYSWKKTRQTSTVQRIKYKSPITLKKPSFGLF